MRLLLTVDDETRAERAAQLLAPATPGRSGRTIRLFSTRSGAGVGPEAVRRLLRRIDAEGIEGTFELVESELAPDAPAALQGSFAALWSAAVERLPSDWTDLYCELELTSTDHLDRAALLVAPLNPLRFGDAAGYRFRCARSFGYGASPEMVQRCLERLDEHAIRGEVRIVHALSDSHPVGTQGPVWHIGGRTV